MLWIKERLIRICSVLSKKLANLAERQEVRLRKYVARGIKRELEGLCDCLDEALAKLKSEVQDNPAAYVVWSKATDATLPWLRQRVAFYAHAVLDGDIPLQNATAALAWFQSLGDSFRPTRGIRDAEDIETKVWIVIEEALVLGGSIYAWFER